jgi:hypothetical protein
VKHTLVLAVLALVPLAVSVDAAEGNKQLARVSGTVEYQFHPRDPYKQLFGSLDLPDDALAVTLADSQGLLRLADSSEVDIGAKARVRIGAFNALGSGKPNVVTLELGAIHFVVRHPAGARANYVFVTPTTQIAVRGTEGYLVTGPKGTDFYCAACAEGDVTMRVGDRTIPLVTGQQVFVNGTDPATAETNVVKEPCTNPAAIAISKGKLGNGVPPAQQVDTTGSIAADPHRPVNLKPPKPRPSSGPAGY